MSKQFSHKISLGQNFLLNPRVSELCLEAGAPRQEDVILEIGPGQGALTRRLLESDAGFVHAIEIDRRLSEWLCPLEEEFHGRLKITWEDVMQCSLASLDPLPNKILANIPYNITSPLIWKALEELAPLELTRMILLVQKEAADRLSASPSTRDRCPLGITIELMGSIRSLMKVSPGSFNPPPKVWSTLMLIEVTSNRHLAGNVKWRKMLKAAFAQRRKKLFNNLSVLYDREMLTSSFDEARAGTDMRAEELTAGQWLALHKSLNSDRK